MAAEHNDWGEWLSEAHQVISDWEHARGRGLLLGVAEASDLAERIARALVQAFERGRAAR
jgi:hypothetical protein